jgi:proline iminopeptidase
MRQRLYLTTLIAMAGWMLGGPPHARPAQVSPAPQHPAGRYVLVNGAKLWTESEGRGAPMILVAGGPGLPHDYFHPYFSGLAPRCRLIYYDAFGRGKSDHAANPAQYTFRRDVEDLDGVRKALGLERVSLFGHSYGSLVALAYAFDHPEAVDRVAIANGMFSGKMWQDSDDIVNRAIREQLPAVWRQVQSVRAQGKKSNTEVHQQAYRLPPGYYWHRRPAQVPNLEYNEDVYYGILGEDADFVIGGQVARLDYGRRLKELRVPLLILAGRYDNICPVSYALALSKVTPLASVVVLEQSGHFVFIEEREKTMALLGDFMAQDGRAAKVAQRP